MRFVEVTRTVFELSELCGLYCNHLKKLNAPLTSKVHTSRLKERIRENFPAVTAVPHGRDVSLTFSEHIGTAMQQIPNSADADAIRMMHAAKLIRNQIFSHSSPFTANLSNHDTSVSAVAWCNIVQIGRTSKKNAFSFSGKYSKL